MSGVIGSIVALLIIGLFLAGDTARGCTLLLLAGIVLLLLVHAISEASIYDWIVFGPIFLAAIAVYLGIMIPKWRRIKQEKEKFGLELNDKDRQRIREIGEEAWVNEQTGDYGISVFCHYTDYKERQKKTTQKEDTVTANKKDA